MAIDKIKLNSLGTTGTASSSNFLRGDMAWTAIAGDIESVTAGTGLNGGGSSGDVTLNVDAAQTTITSLASNVVISTSGAITTTGAFTSIGIDDNAASTAVTIDGSQNVAITQKTFLGGMTTSIPVSNGQQNWLQSHEASNRGGTTWFSTHNSNGAAESVFAKGRSGSIGSYTIVQDDDALGRLTWCADDGVDMNSVSAQLSVFVDGTPGANDTPGRFSFLTTADGAASPTERMTIDSSGVLNLLDNVIQKPEMKDYSETKTAVAAAATVDLDMTSGNVFTVTPDQNTTFTFSNPSPTGKSCAFTLIWTQDSSDRTITWPGTVDWAGGAAPDVTSGSGKIDVYTFFTLDAGTIWYGFQAGADLG